MFYIHKNTELSTQLLTKFLNIFNTSVAPKLQRWDNYYKGNHAILSKSYADESKACNRIVTNYCKIIADTYNGYICGKPVTYTSNDDITDVQEIINYNDDTAANISWLGNALMYGVGYELQWIDKFSQVRYSQVSPLNAFAIYDNTLESELLYFVRWYKEDSFEDSNIYYLEVYSAENIKTYKMNGFNGAFEFIEEKPHYFKDVPVSVFMLNDNEECIFECVRTLNDAYNELQSAEIDDFQAWVDCYLKLTGVDADSDDLQAMKAARTFLLPEGASADWLTKNANDTQIVNILNNIKTNIFKVTNCPDMADDTFLAQSGTALAYKLVGFENIASNIVARFTKAIQRRIELICNILNLKTSEAIWRDIVINFKRNIPPNVTETIQLINALKGTVSDKTLIAQLPFIDDVEAELAAVQLQKQANMSLYNFDTAADTDNKEDVE